MVQFWYVLQQVVQCLHGDSPCICTIFNSGRTRELYTCLFRQITMLRLKRFCVSVKFSSACRDSSVHLFGLILFLDAVLLPHVYRNFNFFLSACRLGCWRHLCLYDVHYSNPFGYFHRIVVLASVVSNCCSVPARM